MAAKLNHIKDLIPLPANPRKHNPRNIGMIVDSLQEVGTARSIVIDENNEILAGNGTIEAAAEAGITRMQVVESDGETIIAVRRVGLTPQQKARLAVLDNRTNETSDWDAEVLAAMAEDGVPLGDLFSDEELAALLNQADAPGLHDPDDAPADGYKEQFGVIVMCSDAGEQETTYNRLKDEGYSCKVVTV